MPLTRHILAVDDNSDVLDVVHRILQQLGYNVSSTTSALLAADVSDEDLEALVMLITDVDMPTMNGYALADALRARRPALPVLIISGSNSTASRMVRGDGPLFFLPKPFTARDLDVAIRECLAGVTAAVSAEQPDSDGWRLAPDTEGAT